MDKKTVGIADVQFVRGDGTLITYALGSCVGIAFYDPVIQLGALLHIMLPVRNGQGEQNIYKFADTGIRETLRKMAAFGAGKGRISVKIAGGARMFEMQQGSVGNIGERNVESVRKMLRSEGICIRGEDVGGGYARTMSLEIPSGKVKVRTFGRPEIIL